MMASPAEAMVYTRRRRSSAAASSAALAATRALGAPGAGGTPVALELRVATVGAGRSRQPGARPTCSPPPAQAPQRDKIRPTCDCLEMGGGGIDWVQGGLSWYRPGNGGAAIWV